MDWEGTIWEREGREEGREGGREEGEVRFAPLLPLLPSSIAAFGASFAAVCIE